MASLTPEDLRDVFEGLLSSRVPDDRLWDMEDVANYLRCSKSQAQKAIVCQTGFPSPIQTTPGTTVKKLWVPEEVKKWALRQRAA